MAKYRETEAENGQGLFLSINLKAQLLPGTLEYMLDRLIGEKIDISCFDKHYRNDKTGAKAIPPKVLLKLILYGYSKGVKSSRKLEELSKHNVIAKALSEDIEPHWTSIANFLSNNSREFQEIFVKVLSYCVELGLVGGNTFAIDGLRLPSNASSGMTGTQEELEKKLNLYRRMAIKHIRKHEKEDELGERDEKKAKRYEARQKKLNQQIEKISGFLERMELKESSRGKEIRSNVTDNESALILAHSKYIQGYIGIAVSDNENQIIVEAEAVGSSGEGKHMPEILDGTLENLKYARVNISDEKPITMLSDANYYSEENLEACQNRGIEAIMPDIHYRKRLGNGKKMTYEASDFKYREEGNYYECPAGQKLEYSGESRFQKKWRGKVYRANVKKCRVCSLFSQCMKSKKEQQNISNGKTLIISKSNEPGSLCRAMIEKMKTEEYQNKYSYRMGIIEPVFANISYCKHLNRFNLRGKRKVNGLWQLFCTVHNLEKCLKEYNKKIYV
jgi:transposase